MDNWSLEYDKFRLDNILIYYQTGNEYILSTMCVFTGVERYLNIYDGDEDWILSPGCCWNPYFVHPITEKRHTALYSTGYDIIDGYGTLYPSLKFNYDTIYEDGRSYKVRTKPITQAAKWWNNIQKKSPINIYGEFPPGNNIQISEETNQLSAASFSGIDSWVEIVNLYKNPNNIKNKIKRNYELFQESFI